MRILVVNNLYPPQAIGGYERGIADCARLLKSRGHDVLVLTSNQEKFQVSHTLSLTEPTVRRNLLLTGTWGEAGAKHFSSDQIPIIITENQKTLTQELQTFQPDVCLAGNVDFLEMAFVRAILAAGVPIAHYVMNARPGYLAEYAPRTPLYQYITCSDWIKNHLQEHGYPTETAQTIYPGAAVEEFYQPYLLPHDHLRIVYASLVMPYKGADVLIEALSVLNAMDVEFTASIAGGSLQPDFVYALKEFVESEEMSDRVQFMGALSREQLKELYLTHNVLVFPSRFQEPFGISQIEAMAAGLTLITSGTGGAGEIVEHGNDGFIFEAENSLDLADILSSLPRHPEEWEAVTHAGQQTALHKFNQAHAIEKLESVLFQLAHLKAHI
ncbi:MAG: glycosyltransferase family 4 protein [Cyanobacteria bacterium RU_5_0]|nr:glycosyltransferase family 4 protein [Cyanobacteria bacterium RU_5_0]